MMRRSLALLLLLALPLTAQEARTIGEFTMVHDNEALEVISQDRTGTCWSFATLSFLESEVLRMHGKSVDLSEMFLVRYAIQEKARRYVMLSGKAQFSEGGLSHDIVMLGRKHGIVPQADYTGYAEGAKRYDHSELFSLLEIVLKKFIEDGNEKRSPHWLAAVGGLANAYMGTPPTEITVDGKTMTPKAYADNVLKMPWDDYVEVMSFSYAPFNEFAELLVPDNWMRHQGYLNLPLADMMRGMDAAIAKGFTVAVDMDVSEKGFRMNRGVATLSPEFEKPGAITQALRDQWFANGKTSDDHLMHVTGIAKDKDGKKYYLTKNSWGAVGPFGGYLFISENFMRAKLLAFMVHRGGLPEDCSAGASR